jgi:sulfur transfer protein SufE
MVAQKVKAKVKTKVELELNLELELIESRVEEIHQLLQASATKEDKLRAVVNFGQSYVAQQTKANQDWKTAENLVAGCQTKVWVHLQSGNLELQVWVDSESAVMRGIVALLVSVFNHRQTTAIGEYLTKIGIEEIDRGLKNCETLWELMGISPLVSVSKRVGVRKIMSRLLQEQG